MGWIRGKGVRTGGVVKGEGDALVVGSSDGWVRGLRVGGTVDSL